jgi:hypothetical protein
MRNTTRKVTTDVPVLITNCHVSENPNNGPVSPQIIIIIIAIIKANGLPVPLVTAWENLLKNLLNRFLPLFTNATECALACSAGG